MDLINELLILIDFPVQPEIQSLLSNFEKREFKVLKHKSRQSLKFHIFIDYYQLRANNSEHWISFDIFIKHQAIQKVSMLIENFFINKGVSKIIPDDLPGEDPDNLEFVSYILSPYIKIDYSIQTNGSLIQIVYFEKDQF